MARSQLALFTDEEGSDLYGRPSTAGGVHLPLREPTEDEVAAWLRARGYRVARAGTKSRHPEPGDRKRLSRQCRQILSLLRGHGVVGVWNTQLARIALKYTGRISEIRGAGYRVEVVERHRDGRRRYALVGVPSCGHPVCRGAPGCENPIGGHGA